MSFYPQPNSYSCGPFALKYALVMLGQFRDERLIAHKAGSSWWYGTDETGLAKASRSFNCTMKHFQSADKQEAVRKLRKYLRRGIPCILSVDGWEHWHTVVSEGSGRFVIMDSKFDNVIVVSSERQLLRRWYFFNDETGEPSYDGYAIIPNYKVTAKARFTVERARQVMQKRNYSLAMKWNTYFNDLLAICKPLTPNAKRTLSFTEFLRRHEGLLVKQVADWHGAPSYAELRKQLDNLQFVAETYHLLIYVRDQKKAFIDLACILMMYSCGKYGMEPIY